MYCLKCGRQNPDTSTFCVACGVPLAQPPAARAPKGWVFAAIGASVVALGLLVAIILVVLNPPKPGGNTTGSDTPQPPEPQPPVVSLPFYDDFQKLDQNVWSATSCIWSVDHGVLIATRGRKCSIYLMGGRSWTDYTVEVDIYRPNEAGIIVRAQGDRDYVIFTRAPSAYFCWYVVKDGRTIASCLNALDKELPREKAHIRIDVNGSNYDAYVNGIHVSHLENAAFDKGMPGLYVSYEANPAVTFANFRAVPLKAR